MTRLLVPVSFALMLVSSVAAAPVPKVSADKKLSEIYGEIVDPGSDCKCEMGRDGTLRITVPAGHRPTETNHPNTAPPLVVREVEGDFVITVRVSHTFNKEAGMAEGAKKQTVVAAGVALLAPGDMHTKFTFVHRQQKTGDKWQSGRYMQCMHRGGGSGSGSGSPKLEEEPVYLRLTRQGDVLKGESSSDGQKWQRFTQHTIKGLSPVVTIGPTAFQSTDADYVAEFSEYEIQPLKEEKK